MLQSEVIQPLETTRNKIKEQLSTVQEYRLLVALEKCISQIPDISNDTMTTLERVKEKLKECLQEVRELRVIEETIVEWTQEFLLIFFAPRAGHQEFLLIFFAPRPLNKSLHRAPICS
jgi:hypothetical protein